jgi:hypothetical protein
MLKIWKKKKSAIDKVMQGKEKQDFEAACLAVISDRMRLVGLSIVPFNIVTGVLKPSTCLYLCGLDDENLHFFSLTPIWLDKYNKLTVSYKNESVGDLCGVCYTTDEGSGHTGKKYSFYIDWEATLLLENGMPQYDYIRLGLMLTGRKMNLTMLPDVVTDE